MRYNTIRTGVLDFQTGPEGGGEANGSPGIFVYIYGKVRTGNHKFQPNSSEEDTPFKLENALLIPHSHDFYDLRYYQTSLFAP